MLLRHLFLILFMAVGISAQGLVEVQRAFGKTRDPSSVQERREGAIRSLGVVNSRETVRILLQALLQTEKEVIAIETRRVDYLEKGKKDREEQSRASLDPLVALQNTLITKLASARGPGVITEMVTASIALDRLPFRARMQLARTAASGDAAALSTAVKRGLSNRKRTGGIIVSLATLEALGKSAQSHAKQVLSFLSDRKPILRERAAATLAALCVPETVKPLIDRLRREKPPTRGRIAQSLEVLTRRPLGESIRGWERFWEKEGPDILAGKQLLGGGLPSAVVASSAGTYHGIPITGNSVIYVFDASQSMRVSLEDKTQKKADKGKSRMDRAQAELIKALSALPPSKKFNIVTFAGRCEVFSEKLVPASRARVQEAQKWIRNIKLKLGTTTYEGLEVAFGLAGRRPGDRFYATSVDTMFVLTDGLPMIPKAGKKMGLVPDKWGKIQGAVTRWNLFRRTKVHTIGLGDGLPIKPLKKLASQNGGEFVHEK